MSEEQLKAFIKKIQFDKTLQEKLRDVADSNEFILIAKDNGFNISLDDLDPKKIKLTDQELESISAANTPHYRCNHTFNTLCCTANANTRGVCDCTHNGKTPNC